MRHQANSKHYSRARPGRRSNPRLSTPVGLIALALVCATPAAASAVSIPALDVAPAVSSGLTNFGVTRNATYRSVAMLGASAPAFAGEASARVTSKVSTGSNRGIAVAIILALFAGLSGLTYSMWRELGRRVGPR